MSVVAHPGILEASIPGEARDTHNASTRTSYGDDALTTTVRTVLENGKLIFH